ncbi:MAG: hypothetical protein EOP63_15530 [Sphingomonadales bacterium]|nr:MAG: hypothetical protein EOP63_15530 [Sphingomonadales bacterium]
MLRLAAAFALGLSALALSSCAATGEAANQWTTVSGKIAYRERIALPPSAQIEVRLDDRHSYAVSARITGDDGKLMFITDTRNSVAFDGGSEIDMGTLNLVKTN